MADNWYYVQKGNRHGPVGLTVVQGLLAKGELRPEDYVWKKGFENWKKIQEVSDIKLPDREDDPSSTPIPLRQLKDLAPDERAIFIRTGLDRGQDAQDYGPFSSEQLKILFKAGRINAKTHLFIPGMHDWKILADFREYEDLFEEMVPAIPEADRRASVRKPILARMFFQNDKKHLYSGLCKDVSLGGMQVLVTNFKGQVGDKISLNVHPENSDDHFTAEGEIVRLLEGNSGFSFRFNELPQDARKSIERHIQTQA